MVFSSITFLFVFLPVVLLIYLPLRNITARNIFLLLSSLFFYYWGEPSFLVVMLSSILWNYLGGLLCGTVRNERARKLFLFLAVAGNLALLAVFKYLDFGIHILNILLRSDIAYRNIALPIGISFFTFQGLSYVIDVYRRQVLPQKNPLYIALYISMFPQLIAGPIVRYIDVEKQLTHRSVTTDKFYLGIQRFTVGLFKKAVIANTLALPADNIFALNVAGTLSCSLAWLGAVLYTLQILFDFSGYSDMAIGLGHMLGFTFAENFREPYTSRSVREFWRRWHISLSTWFRDYVYIPMGGSRSGNVYLHLLIVFFLTGLWHGAAFNFIAWGLWHGAFLLLERLWSKKHTLRNPESILIKAGQHVYTMFVVLIGCVFFRSEGLSLALPYLKSMFFSLAAAPCDISFFVDLPTLFVLLLAIVLSTGVPAKLGQWCENRSPIIYLIGKNLGVVALLLLSAVFVMTSTYSPFIYFRF